MGRKAGLKGGRWWGRHVWGEAGGREGMSEGSQVGGKADPKRGRWERRLACRKEGGREGMPVLGKACLEGGRL